MSQIRRSHYWPFKAGLTEKNLPNQAGKVFLITGASSGVGKELANILYQHDAKVWLAARSKSKTMQVIEEIKTNHPNSKGQLLYLQLQLDDLTTIKKSADEFLSQEKRLDVLWNNAGVMVPPDGSVSVQGYELQLGTNNLGHFLFTHFLTPLLTRTAEKAPEASVRVIWVSSSAADYAPSPAIDFSNMDYHVEESSFTKYFRSKAGNVLHSVEYARRHKNSGIISLSLNPGNLATGLQKDLNVVTRCIFQFFAYEAIKGAYTELYAGLSTLITTSDNGGWVCPFGKKQDVRSDLLDLEMGKRYWEWTEEQVKPYM